MCLAPQHYLGHASKGVMCTLTHKGVAGGGAGVQGDSDEPPSLLTVAMNCVPLGS